MANLGLLPLGNGTLYDGNTTAVTTSTTSGVLTVPLADSYRWIMLVNTVSGTTSPTLDVYLDTSADGTNYFPFLHFAQATTSGAGQQAIMRPFMGTGDVATTAAANLLGTLDGATGSTAIVQNGPINIQKIKVRAVIGGSGSPSFNFLVQYIALAGGSRS